MRLVDTRLLVTKANEAKIYFARLMTLACTIIQLELIAHFQGQRTEHKHGTKNIAELSNHFPPTTK